MIRDSVADFLSEKQRLVRKGNLSEATREHYQRVLESVWLPWCETQGVESVGDCTDAVLERYTDDLTAIRRQRKDGKCVPLSAATVRTYIRAVRVFLTWADVPKGKYTPPRQHRRIVDVLTRQEIDRLERAAPNERDRLMVRVLADTGIRVGELLGLRRADLRGNSHDRKYLIRVLGKGDKERDVSIPIGTYDRLKHYAEHNGHGDYIFEGNHEGHLGRHVVDKRMRQMAVQAGIGRRVWPHLLRHSYASHMITKGINLVVLQKTLGHESLAMISTVYSHVLAEDAHDDLMRALK